MTPGLRLDGVGVAVDGTVLLDDVSLAVTGGTLLAVVGPNGAGKTTLLRAIGARLAVTGAVTIDEIRVETLARTALARRLALVTADDVAVAGVTVREVVNEGRYAHRRSLFDRDPAHEAAVARALARTELGALADRAIATLSSGERRRVWIALGLAQEAGVLALDEPTANLDLRHAQETLATLRALADDGAVVVTVLHDLNEAAQFADLVAIVDRARLVAFGPPREVLTRERIEATYGTPVEILRAADGTPRIVPRRARPAGSSLDAGPRRG